MKNIKIQSISLIITALTLLYLLSASVFRKSFVPFDWIIVAFDLLVKLLAEVNQILKK